MIPTCNTNNIGIGYLESSSCVILLVRSLLHESYFIHSEMLMNKKTHYQYRRVDATCNTERDVVNGFFKEGKKDN
jgi:hypothetical protein